MHDATGLAALPEPHTGDIFFDFEGDPLWTDGGGGPTSWNLEYLFGVIEHEGGEREHFRPFWAHDRAEEKRATIDFLTYVRDRRRRHPGMHIYHYADYERSHLQQLCARHGVGEQILDELLEAGVFVDLYPIVKRSIRISANSYSLKKVEQLYMGDELRTGDVTNAADSVQQYVDYCQARDAGRTEEAQRLLAEIADYNRYDCVSTLRLRDWLLGLADAHGVSRRPAIDPAESRRDAELARREDAATAALLAPLDGVAAPDRDADQTALALAAAAIEYHRREDKSYWWEHFNREIAPVETWEDQRDVLVVHDARVATDWEPPAGRQSLWRRTVTLAGRLTPGSGLGESDDPFVMYTDPAPEGCGMTLPGQRGEHSRTRVLSIGVSARAEADTVVTLEERGPAPWPQLPMALTPKPPIRTAAQREAILEWGEALAAALPGPPDGAALDILRRRPPRIDGGLARTGDAVADIVASLIAMSDSYLAVQGPPGSGKTYVGAAVIAALARRGWRIGVAAQSHAVVENLLRQVLANGVPRGRVGKKPGRGEEQRAVPWTRLASNDDIPPFLAATGVVLGGTAWDFANPNKVGRGALDLLVIDEAGQYSLANTIAVAMGARRLLLLGDPQQLPQVSQGVHPEPIQTSALGWLSDGHDVLPDELGYFLAESRRMHPALCAAVSSLSYEGRLGAHPSTALRRLDGVEPGLHPVAVPSADRSVESPEEAAAIVDLLRSLVGRGWSDPGAGRSDTQLDADDVIVVAPYNAQVALLRGALDAAGFTATRVGTVDKFQGQEAPVAIVSMTASSALDVPRGIDFLLLRNRLNVAISRAKWAAYLVHSPRCAITCPTGRRARGAQRFHPAR
ncbi:TM0106 family RecB-like putative nuclease [Pseudolysinimonas kribbensis]|nr:TM0106 family RecB-like putative nuclease [Pseudolysinimonas kribbensis]